ncbi:MAG TPA: hypothetical protein VE779_06505 [Candidatus Angelobacter sp.]|nr:hypothetical protein [Candidatus Angelobacter sp.]
MAPVDASVLPFMLPDTTLVHFAQGHPDALLDVYRTYAPIMRRRLGKVFPTPFARGEALQEFWLLVRAQAATYHPDREPLSSWLLSVALARWPELRRPHWRRPEGAIRVDVESNGEWLDAETPATAASPRLAEAASAFASTLGGEAQALFRVSLVEETPLDEIVSAVGVSRKRALAAKVNLLCRAAADPAVRALAQGLLR